MTSYDYIIKMLEAAKPALFDGVRASATDFQRFAHAQSLQHGYDMAINEIKRLRDNDDAFQQLLLGQFPK